jgi:hypothetical protein
MSASILCIVDVRMITECGDGGEIKIGRGEPKVFVEIAPHYRFVDHNSHTA